MAPRAEFLARTAQRQSEPCQSTGQAGQPGPVTPVRDEGKVDAGVTQPGCSYNVAASHSSGVVSMRQRVNWRNAVVNYFYFANDPAQGTDDAVSFSLSDMKSRTQ